MELTKDEYEKIISTHQRTIDILLKKDKDEPWYIRFDDYAESVEFFDQYKYDPRLKRYFHYEHGVFHEICPEAFIGLFNEWGNYFNENMSPSKVKFLRDRYTARIVFTEQWDPDPNIDNCLNGLVFKEERELRPHSTDYPTLYQIQRNYIDVDELPEVAQEPELMRKMVAIIKDDLEREWFLQFLINMVHQFYDDELFVIFYGPRNGGKSTLLRLIESLFGREIVSKTALQTIGTKFGLEDLYDKRANVNPDLPTIDLDEFTISMVKLLTGNDGLIPINIKGVRKFSYEIHCFLLFGINQLMGFNVKNEKESESIYRRALLLHVPDKLPSDPEFKKSTYDPVFLDQLYSWLVYQRPRSIIKNLELTPEQIKDQVKQIDLWVNIQKTKWFQNSNPILQILQELYKFEEGSEVPAHTVQEKVLEQMDSDDTMITSKSFKSNITQALSTMRIYKNAQHGLNAKYINIAEVI